MMRCWLHPCVCQERATERGLPKARCTQHAGTLRSEMPGFAEGLNEMTYTIAVEPSRTAHSSDGHIFTTSTPLLNGARYWLELGAPSTVSIVTIWSSGSSHWSLRRHGRRCRPSHREGWSLPDGRIKVRDSPVRAFFRDSSDGPGYG